MTIFGFIWAFLKSPFNLLIIAIISLVLGAGGWWIYSTKKENEGLHTQVIQLEKDKTALQKNNEILKQTNEENVKALDDLVSLNKKRDAIEKELRNKITEDKSNIAILKRKIAQAQEKDNGPVAPVLKDTITTIDASRVERMKGEVK